MNEPDKLRALERERNELREALIRMENASEALLHDLSGDCATLQDFRRALAQARATLGRTAWAKL